MRRKSMITLTVPEHRVDELYDALWSLLKHGAVIEFHKRGMRSTVSVYCMDLEEFRECEELVNMLREVVGVIGYE